MNGAPAGLGLVALLAGGACIGLSPIFALLAAPETSLSASVFWRVFLAIPVLWLWLTWSERGRPATSMPRKAMFLTALFFTGDLAFWHAALAHTSVANATLEANFAPVFVTLGGWLLFGQQVTRAFVIALVVTLAGAALLVAPNLQAGGRAIIGDVFGVITACFYAAYMLAVKAASPNVSVPRIALTTSIGCSLFLLPYAWFTAEHFAPSTAVGWGLLIALALISHALGQSLIMFGLGRVPASLGAVTLLVQPLLAAFFAWLFLAEPMGAIQMAGGAVVLFGIYLARRAS